MLGVIVYECLTGVNPFLAPLAADTIKNIVEKPIDLEKLKELAISAEVIDLISELLQKRPVRRIGIAQAIQHEWIKVGAF